MKFEKVFIGGVIALLLIIAEIIVTNGQGIAALF